MLKKLKAFALTKKKLPLQFPEQYPQLLFFTNIPDKKSFSSTKAPQL